MRDCQISLRTENNADTGESEAKIGARSVFHRLAIPGVAETVSRCSAGILARFRAYRLARDLFHVYFTYPLDLDTRSTDMGFLRRTNTGLCGSSTLAHWRVAGATLPHV